MKRHKPVIATVFGPPLPGVRQRCSLCGATRKRWGGKETYERWELCRDGRLINYPLCPGQPRGETP